MDNELEPAAFECPRCCSGGLWRNPNELELGDNIECPECGCNAEFAEFIQVRLSAIYELLEEYEEEYLQLKTDALHSKNEDVVQSAKGRIRAMKDLKRALPKFGAKTGEGDN